VGEQRPQQHAMALAEGDCQPMGGGWEKRTEDSPSLGVGGHGHPHPQAEPLQLERTRHTYKVVCVLSRRVHGRGRSQICACPQNRGRPLLWTYQILESESHGHGNSHGRNQVCGPGTKLYIYTPFDTFCYFEGVYPPNIRPWSQPWLHASHDTII